MENQNLILKKQQELKLLSDKFIKDSENIIKTISEILEKELQMFYSEDINNLKEYINNK